MTTYVHKDSTYMMFLHERFFKKSFFRSLYDIVVKNLQNRGIMVVSINSIIDYQNENTNNILSFNDNKYPDCNVLYIHLFNGTYYSDNIYSNKKLEKEREMLLLLAGKLGVRKIEYSTEIIETTYEKVAASVKVHDVDVGTKFAKNTKKSNGTKGCEIYLNRGAPVYLYSKTIDNVDENIKNKFGSMESNIFSYEFYKKNYKLEAFVYKRFEFKMQQLDYTIEVEDISDKSFEIKSFLMGCGVGFAYENNVSHTEKINYKFEFFNDKELRLAFFEIEQRNKDEFINIREVYDNHADKNIAVNYIIDYVKKEIEIYEYMEKDSDEFKNLYKLFSNWINYQSKGHFEGICHNFFSAHQIHEWIYNTFKTDNIINLRRNGSDNLSKPYSSLSNHMLIQGIDVDRFYAKSSSEEEEINEDNNSIHFIDTSDDESENIKKPKKTKKSKIFINELYTRPNKFKKVVSALKKFSPKNLSPLKIFLNVKQKKPVDKPIIDINPLDRPENIEMPIIVVNENINPLDKPENIEMPIIVVNENINPLDKPENIDKVI